MPALLTRTVLTSLMSDPFSYVPPRPPLGRDCGVRHPVTRVAIVDCPAPRRAGRVKAAPRSRRRQPHQSGAQRTICAVVVGRALTRPGRRGHARRGRGPSACAPGNRGALDPARPIRGRPGRPGRSGEEREKGAEGPLSPAGATPAFSISPRAEGAVKAPEPVGMWETRG